MANSLSLNQAVTVLNSLVSQELGIAGLTATDTSSFVSVAQTALLAGIDAIGQGITQVLDRTIFSTRPYYAKFPAMEKTNSEYGAFNRKINYCDLPLVQDDGFNLVDGTSIDPWVIRKPDVIEMRYYGQSVLADHITKTEEQLKMAFRGPDEFSAFWAGVLQNLSNVHEQKTEAIARGVIANAIGAIYDSSSTTQIVHLLTEYNAQTGKSLTSTTVYDPDNYTDFMKWTFARIQVARDFLTERNAVFHLNVPNASKVISRHTPYDKQILYMYSPELRQMEARVLSAAYNEGRLAYKSIELVNYWQSIDTPDSVDVYPVYIDADGVAYSPSTGGTPDNVQVDNVFALLVDDDAMGYTRYSDGMYATQVNARARYQNWFYNWRWMSWTDFTEQMILFVLD